MLKPRLDSGRRIRFTPPAKAWSALPSQIERQAMWSATRADEQAVSTVALGPRRSKRNETRLEIMLPAAPVLLVGPIWTCSVWIVP